MKQRETLFKERVLRDLRALPRTWCTKISQVAIRGTPDIIGTMAGNFFALELKASEKARVEPLQMHTLERIVDAGGSALITYPANWEITKEALVKQFLKDVPPEEWRDAHH